jgi:hypothetical protein
MAIVPIQKIFAYNTGAPISGTSQVGDIAISDIATQYSDNYGGVQWWGGPDETNGYVIAHTDPTGGHNGEPSTPAYLGFWRSSALTDQSFLDLCNSIPPRIGYPPFTNTSDASAWLAANGYWTSFNSITPTPTATQGAVTPTPTASPVAPTPTPSVTHTPTATPVSATPTPTPTHSAPSGFTVTINEVGPNVVMSASGSLDLTGLILVATGSGPLGGGIGVSTATFLMGTTGSTFDLYSGFTSTPSNFGAGGAGGNSTSSSGDVFGVIFQGAPPYELAVPNGYTSGTAISSTQTFASASFTSLGLTQGTYTYTWGAGNSIDVVVGGGGVTPTPTATSQTPTPTPTSGATGDFTVTVSQQGPNVVWNGSGKFNLGALSFVANLNIGAGYQSNMAIWAIGPNTTIDQYQGTITYPNSFGTGGTPVTTTSGSTFGILPGGSGRTLYVPSGYTSNTTISGTATYANTTIATMGLSGGTYTWSWGSGGNSSTIVMNIVP